MYLGEEKPSLERGEQGDGEVIRVEAGQELPAGLKGPEPFADFRCPAFEPGGHQGPGLRVALGELAAERAEGAAALAWTRSAAVITMSRQAWTPSTLPRSACRWLVTARPVPGRSRRPRISGSVRELVDAVHEAAPKGLNGLVNNAGAAFSSKALSPDGYERTIAINHSRKRCGHYVILAPGVGGAFLGPSGDSNDVDAARRS